MWNRFTERARRAIYGAQVTAGKHHTRVVGLEHLLMGILLEKETASAQMLAAMGTPPALLIEDLEPILKMGTGSIFERQMRLDIRSKAAIDQAYQEAHRLGNDWIGTEHLLLGAIGSARGPVLQLLQKYSISLETARTAHFTIFGLSTEAPGENTQTPPTPVLVGAPLDVASLRRQQKQSSLKWKGKLIAIAIILLLALLISLGRH